MCKYGIRSSWVMQFNSKNRQQQQIQQQQQEQEQEQNNFLLRRSVVHLPSFQTFCLYYKIAL